MKTMITLDEAAAYLKQVDNILVLSHQYPDGDTLGSASALCRALQKLGKTTWVACSDEIGPKYAYLFEGVEPMDFTPEAIVAVDVADNKLLGEPLLSKYGSRVDLCVDHHGSNVEYAKRTYVDSKAASTTEIIYDLVCLLGVPIDEYIANSIYTGISTDTGCFRYTNATPHTYRVAADMMEAGAKAATINRIMFDTKTRQRMEIERLVVDTLRYYFSNHCAVIQITQEMIETAGVREDDMEGLAAIPRQVEGVLAGITIREKKEGGWKISLRTQPPINAAKICQKFGGGGHAAAAGCTLSGNIDEVRKKIVAAVGEVLERL